jgi:hypothetical protein
MEHAPSATWKENQTNEAQQRRRTSEGKIRSNTNEDRFLLSVIGKRERSKDKQKLPVK